MKNSKLISALKKGKRQAFVKIYDLHWESLFAVGIQRIGRQEIVEDMIQEIFCDLWTRRHTLEIKTSLNAYLHTALKYKVFDFYRKSTVKLETIDQSHNFISSDLNAEKVLSFKELKDRIEEGIETLPERCKLVFKMSRNEGKTAKEISEELNVSRRTVETQIHHSIKHLKSYTSGF